MSSVADLSGTRWVLQTVLRAVWKCGGSAMVRVGSALSHLDLPISDRNRLGLYFLYSC